MFHSARLKLTIWYMVIAMLVSVTFSIVIYQGSTREIERFEEAQRTRIERRLKRNNVSVPDLPAGKPPIPLVVPTPELIAQTKQNILTLLATINLAIFILSGGLGYFLAGRTLKPIAGMMDEQNRFISDASHELRTPITSLKSAMEVHLRDKNLNIKDARTLIANSLEDIEKLQSLSNALLELAQYQIPNGNLAFVTVSTNAIIKQAIQKLQPIAAKKQITPKYQEPKEDIMVNGDKTNLVDLFVILLDNALKYSPKKSTVEISVQKDDGSVDILIKDKGIGIAAPDLEHIFERFYRADKARTHQAGYGLGLSIAQKIAQLHHGTISVKSTPQKGSQFTVHLPAAKS